MKRLIIIMGVAALGSCHPRGVEKSCYTCQVYSNASQNAVSQKEFCDKAEMNRFVEESKNKPEISFVNCRNKGDL